MKKEFGDLINESWKEYKDNFKVFLKIFIIFYAIPSILFSFLSSSLGTPQTLEEITLIIKNPIFGISALLFFIIYIFMTACFLYNSLYRKKKMNMRETLLGGKKYFFKYLLFFIVHGILLLILYSLLVIPGIIFSVFWIFSVYILIGENKGIIESLRNGFHLVREKWWRTFGFCILFFLIIGAINISFFIIKTIVNTLIALPFLLKGGSFDLTQLASITLPKYIQYINNSLISLLNLGKKLITFPLGILFFKNFYLDCKGKKSKK